MGNVLFDLTDSSGADVATAKPGDTFAFTVTVDLPQITDATDIKMEIYGFDPNSGVGGFAICNTAAQDSGSQVTAGDPSISSQYHDDFSGVVSTIMKDHPHNFTFDLILYSAKKVFWNGAKYRPQLIVLTVTQRIK